LYGPPYGSPHVPFLHGVFLSVPHPPAMDDVFFARFPISAVFTPLSLFPLLCYLRPIQPLVLSSQLLSWQLTLFNPIDPVFLYGFVPAHACVWKLFSVPRLWPIGPTCSPRKSNLDWKTEDLCSSPCRCCWDLVRVPPRVRRMKVPRLFLFSRVLSPDLPSILPLIFLRSFAPIRSRQLCQQGVVGPCAGRLPVVRYFLRSAAVLVRLARPRLLFHYRPMGPSLDLLLPDW